MTYSINMLFTNYFILWGYKLCFKKPDQDWDIHCVVFNQYVGAGSGCYQKAKHTF